MTKLKSAFFLYTRTFYMARCLGKQTAVTLISVNLRVVNNWLHKMRHGPRQIVQGRDNNIGAIGNIGAQLTPVI
jgi:hypothetical protein